MGGQLSLLPSSQLLQLQKHLLHGRVVTWGREQGGPVCELDGLGLDEYGELVPALSRRRKASRCPQAIRFPRSPIWRGAGAGLFREEPRRSQPRSCPSRKGEVLLGCVWVSAVGGRECVELQRRVFPTWKGGSLGLFACCWQAPCPVE